MQLDKPIETNVVIDIFDKHLWLLPTKEIIKIANTVLKIKFSRGEISICLVTKTRIEKLNRDYRKINSPTNILSFPPTEPFSIWNPSFIGDIAICPEIINNEADDLKLSYSFYWAKIIVHGCLHLLGFQHSTNNKAKIMAKEEMKILTILNFTLHK